MARPRSSERTKPTLKDADLLEEVHDRFKYAVDRWRTNREEARIDMRHVKGDPWDPKEKEARLKAKRPVIALDELSQYENQVVNEVRANPRAIKFSPVGDGANDKTAEFYGGKTREIEYRSHAQQHYTRAFQNMVERGYGYCKIRTEYVTDKPAKPTDPWSAFTKRLVIDGVADPDSIYPDPDFVDATGRDWKFLFEVESHARPEFKREFPNAEIQNFTPELVKYSNGWIDKETLRIAAYWKVNITKRPLCAYEVMHPETQQPAIYEFWKDDKASEQKIAFLMSQGATLKAERDVEERSVVQYLTNGVEILKRTPWPGKWIPYYAFFGKMLWMDTGNGASELVIMSMTRLARDPNMLHAYYTSCEAEMIGMTPKVPWWVWKGSLDKTNAIKAQKANHEPVPFIEVDTTMAHNGQATPSLPQRVPFTPPVEAIEVGKEGARRSIQASMGLSPLPTSAQRRNEKSGVALKQIEESGQRGSYHFIDSYDMGIERGGELLEDLIPKVHDTPGLTPVLDPQKKPTNVYIGAEKAPDTLDKGVEAIPSIEGLHAVTIDVGPAYASERQQASDFVDTFVASPVFQALPPEMGLQILSLLVKLKNLGPIGEQIAELLSPNQDEQQIPPEAQAALQKGAQLVQALKGRIQQLEAEKAAKVTETQGKLALAAKQNEGKERIESMKADSAIEKTELQGDIDLTLQKKQQEFEMRMARMEALLEAHFRGTEREDGERDRAFQSQEAGAERQHNERQGDKERSLKASTAVLAAKSKQQQAKKGGQPGKPSK